MGSMRIGLESMISVTDYIVAPLDSDHLLAHCDGQGPMNKRSSLAPSDKPDHHQKSTVF